MELKRAPDSAANHNKRWCSAPPSTRNHTGTIEGVWLEPGEIVDWHLVYYPDGSQSVTGYTITYFPPKTELSPQIGQLILNSNDTYIAQHQN